MSSSSPSSKNHEQITSSVIEDQITPTKTTTSTTNKSLPDQSNLQEVLSLEENITNAIANTILHGFTVLSTTYIANTKNAIDLNIHHHLKLTYKNAPISHRQQPQQITRPLANPPSSPVPDLAHSSPRAPSPNLAHCPGSSPPPSLALEVLTRAGKQNFHHPSSAEMVLPQELESIASLRPC